MADNKLTREEEDIIEQTFGQGVTSYEEEVSQTKAPGQNTKKPMNYKLVIGIVLVLAVTVFVVFKFLLPTLLKRSPAPVSQQPTALPETKVEAKVESGTPANPVLNLGQTSANNPTNNYGSIQIDPTKLANPNPVVALVIPPPPVINPTTLTQDKTINQIQKETAEAKALANGFLAGSDLSGQKSATVVTVQTNTTTNTPSLIANPNIINPNIIATQNPIISGMQTNLAQVNNPILVPPQNLQINPNINPNPNPNPNINPNINNGYPQPNLNMQANSGNILMDLKNAIEKQSADIKNSFDIIGTKLSSLEQSSDSQKKINEDIDSRLRRLELSGNKNVNLGSNINNINSNKVAKAARTTAIASPDDVAIKDPVILVQVKPNNVRLKQSKKNPPVLTNDSIASDSLPIALSDETQLFTKATPVLTIISKESKKEVVPSKTLIIIKKEEQEEPETSKYKIHSIFGNRVWIANPDGTHSDFSIGDSLPNGEKIKSIDAEKNLIVTNRGNFSQK